MIKMSKIGHFSTSCYHPTRFDDPYEGYGPIHLYVAVLLRKLFYQR